MYIYIVYVVHACVSVHTSSFVTKIQRVTSTKKNGGMEIVTYIFKKYIHMYHLSLVLITLQVEF